mgnify:CR=1 FL=1
MMKSGIDQDALIQMFATATASGTEQVRKGVTQATLAALQGRELSLKNIRSVLKTVAQSASAGAAMNKLPGVDVEDLLDKAVVGMDEALLKAVDANRVALQQFVNQGADLRDCGTVHVGPMQLRFRDVDGLFCSQGDWFNLGRLVMAEMGRSWPETLQIVWADANGRYTEAPGEPDWFMRQPLLVG